ncbi:MAG: hypothetical protein K9N01_02910, partial [Cephaloticoccus sp.]|nr:hypothetical protein [Cephaloticoccus sp.]
MRHYCTPLDSEYLPRGLALHQSLLRHAGEFVLTILALDEAAALDLRAKNLPQVQVLDLSELLDAHPQLAAARTDREAPEFFATCKPWLLWHLLSSIPAGQWLTLLDADQFFYSTPEPIFKSLAAASIAIVPHQYAPVLEHLTAYGRYDSGWVSLRHDAAGKRCAADWAERCARWCFRILETTRYLDQKYLDVWPVHYKEATVISPAGTLAGPWRLKNQSVSATEHGPKIGDDAIVCYHFSDLTHLGSGLYDAGLHRYDLDPTPEVREVLYRPYLQQLPDRTGPGALDPDLAPPVQTDDPRIAAALPHLHRLLREAKRENNASLAALASNRTATTQAQAEARIAALEARATRR